MWVTGVQTCALPILEKLRLQAEQLNAERETAKQTAVQQRLTEAPRQMEIKDDTNADNIR